MKTNQTNDLSEKIIDAIYGNNLMEIEQWQDIQTINDLDRENRSAIFYAVLSKSMKVVRQLLKSNPCLNLNDKKEWAPLHYAAQNYLTDIAKLLIDKGADIEIKDDYGNTPLWKATFASQGKGEMIKFLLSKGADPNNFNDSDISPLELANTIANYNVKQFFC